MKLSWKIFFIAYIMVLLSAGLGGFILVKNTTDTLWNERVDRCKASHTYAVNSFYSMADMMLLGRSESGSIQSTMEYQIQRTLDSSVTKLEIIPAGQEHKEQAVSVCYLNFTNEKDTCVMEISCKVTHNDREYVIRCESDFSALANQNEKIWMQYRIIITLIAVLCGGILYALAKRLTKPLKEISDAACEISRGNYGLCIDVKGADSEVQTLADNFNTMSTVVAQSLKKVENECRKRDAFVADFTHEIKTPVTSVIGYADMLSSYNLNEEERTEAAQAIYREGKRLEKLSMQLLDLFITENEVPVLSKVSLACVEKSIRDTLKFSAQKYSVKLETEMEDAFVLANEPLLLSLLYNLADNAFKASKPEGVVRISGVSKENNVIFSVTDKGHGIAPQHIEHITEPFYREDKSRSRRNGGAGLGLSLCKEICRLHGTELKVESSKGVGTVVSFSLPLNKEEANNEQ